VTSDQGREMWGEDDFGMYRALRESPSSDITSPESSSDVSPGRGLPEGLEYDPVGLKRALDKIEVELLQEMWDLS
jgi:hypothetical protein